MVENFDGQAEEVHTQWAWIPYALCKDIDQYGIGEEIGLGRN